MIKPSTLEISCWRFFYGKFFIKNAKKYPFDSKNVYHCSLKNNEKMKKYLFMAVAAFTMLTFATSCKKKLTDEAIQKSAQEAIAKTGMATTVSIKDGIATLTGECKDDKCKTDCEAAIKDVKGIKSVVNSCTVTPPPVSMTTTLDAATQKKVTDGLKDIKGAILAGFSAKGAIINGEVSAADNMKIKQMLASAKVMLDAASKLTVKK
jgi:hyperosmotically inducible periplasmic protein